MLHVGLHVQTKRKREMRVDFFLEHGHHIECVAHGVKSQNLGQFLETSSFFSPNFFVTLGTGVHIVSFKGIFDSHLKKNFDFLNFPFSIFLKIFSQIFFQKWKIFTKGLSSIPSGSCIVVPNLCYLSKRLQILFFDFI